MFYREVMQGIVLNVRIMPNASCCAVRGIFTDAGGTDYLKISVVSVPEKGKANKELLTFLAKQLNLPKSNLTIIGGETDRYKKIMLQNATAAQVNMALSEEISK